MKKIEQFIVKLEWEESFSEMSDEQKGILFQNFFDYHQGRELDFKGDKWVKSLWLNMKNNIDRINHNYQTSVENGKKGGAPKGNTNAKKLPKTTQEQPDNNPTTTLKEKEKEKDIVFTSEEVKTNTSELGGYGNFLGKFPPTKIREVEEGKLIWDSFNQEEKQDVIRHATGYVKKMITEGKEQFMKNTLAYLQEEMWLEMKPRDYKNKPINRGAPNYPFIQAFANTKKVSWDEAKKFLYVDATDEEYKKWRKLYDTLEQQNLNKLKNMQTQ